MGPIGPEQQGKPGYMKYAEPRRINEIANQNLTSNQRVGSSSLSGRAKTLAKTMFFGSPSGSNAARFKFSLSWTPSRALLYVGALVRGAFGVDSEG